MCSKVNKVYMDFMSFFTKHINCTEKVPIVIMWQHCMLYQMLNKTDFKKAKRHTYSTKKQPSCICIAPQDVISHLSDAIFSSLKTISMMHRMRVHVALFFLLFLAVGFIAACFNKPADPWPPTSIRLLCFLGQALSLCFWLPQL